MSAEDGAVPPRETEHGTTLEQGGPRQDGAAAVTRLSLDDLPSTPTRATRRSEGRERVRSRRRRRLRALAVAVVALLLVGGGGVLAADQLREVAAGFNAPEDFEGPGSGTVQVRVEPGDSGADIAQSLEEAGVVQTSEAFAAAAAADPESATIVPGLYSLRTRMSSSAALATLLDPTSLLSYAVTIPEGFTAVQAVERLAQGTGSSVEALTAAAADPAVGLPPEAGGQLEGYLFPATYEFDLESTDVQVLTEVVARTQLALDEAGVPPERRQEVLTTASLIQAESGSTADMGKVSRVIANRLATGMALQFDTTVNYATSRGGLTTTDEDRATDSPYNTYLYPGLPAGPINNPGAEAITAAMAPEEGPWTYFVVVDPDTKETRFASSLEEHNANVELFQAWLRANPQ